jgi:hypothetical protein
MRDDAAAQIVESSERAALNAPRRRAHFVTQRWLLT